VLDRVFVLVSSPIALLLARLLQLLLCFGVGKAEAKLDTVAFVGNAVEFLDDLFRNITVLKSDACQQKQKLSLGFIGSPSKSDFLANARVGLATDLG
jgi:hypothetical protein